ncbi:MAG TPA: CocE/NonD family hydrolase [Steroidobacteraceae bacterium]|nr:CocE/NonD family hydrolase [Steroidobacteraceae bacterium]
MNSARSAGIRIVSVVVLSLCTVRGAWAASALDFHAPQSADDSAVPGVMRDLAERVLPVYQEADRERYLANLSALQMVAGDYSAADASRHELRDRRRRKDAGQPVSRALIYDIYAYAKATQSENRVPLANAFARAFNDVVPRLDDRDAYVITRWLESSERPFRDAFQRQLDQLRGTDSIGEDEAVKLIRAYLEFAAYRDFGPFVPALVEADDDRRYTVDAPALVKTPHGSIATVVVRPKQISKPLTALLEIKIEDTDANAKESAAHGYAGVVAHLRGDPPERSPRVPYQHGADEARAIIQWVAAQTWSDGRVGMYGSGYSGFEAWAAASRLPPALKAIATAAPTAPGIDFPMSGSIFRNFAYRWSLYVTTSKESVEKSYGDDALWRALDLDWYKSGRRYRDLGRIHAEPNPIFIRWLNHPSYDRYWQKMVPFRKQFADISIPVLTTTGYFAPSQPGALYYFTEHTRYNPNANHTLILGPYDDRALQDRPAASPEGYQPDAVALIDVHDLQYQWFDHIFKGSAKPELLKDRVNFEVMAANEWGHASTLEAMAGGSLKFYLDANDAGESHRLSLRKGSRATFVRQVVNLADRTEGVLPPTHELTRKNLLTRDQILFESEPLTKSRDFVGLFSARLDFKVNKMDMDLNIAFYEHLASGDYVRLFDPAYELRASYARDRIHRHLLKAGERQELTLHSDRMTSRRLKSGSRLVMLLGINKRPDREINYGTGDDVSEESIADAHAPLEVRWYSDSFIEIPIRK